MAPMVEMQATEQSTLMETTTHPVMVTPITLMVITCPTVTTTVLHFPMSMDIKSLRPVIFHITTKIRFSVTEMVFATTKEERSLDKERLRTMVFSVKKRHGRLTTVNTMSKLVDMLTQNMLSAKDPVLLLETTMLISNISMLTMVMDTLVMAIKVTLVTDTVKLPLPYQLVQFMVVTFTATAHTQLFTTSPKPVQLPLIPLLSSPTNTDAMLVITKTITTILLLTNILTTTVM